MKRTKQNNRAYKALINCERWRQLRAKKLRANVFCERCLLDGIYTPAVVVHHLTPVESAASLTAMHELAYSYGNLQALCRECHRKAHEEIGRKGITREVNKQRQGEDAQAFIGKFFENE